MSTHAPQQGTIHEYAPRLMAFELTKDTNSPNTILFIGGLTDGLMTVPYISQLNNQLPSHWSIFQILITSSYQGWGTGSLDRDVKEISLLVQYLKEKLGKKKVVLMGHSTGTQDSIHYALTMAHKEPGLNIDGIILQAPVSDREAMTSMVGSDRLQELNEEVKQIHATQGKDTVLGKKFSDHFFGGIISAYRWLSLATVGGDDDYFSSDLTDESLSQTFGKLNNKIMVLYSGEDEFATTVSDKHSLVQRWKGFVRSELWSDESKVISNGTHNLDNCGEDPVKVMCESVLRFIQDI